MLRRVVFKRLIVAVLIFLLMFPGNLFAQREFLLPSQYWLSLTPAYTPTLLRGITVDPKRPFKFEFMVDTWHSQLEDEALRRETQRLI